uniref:hypothetical protein n=1 Tax=Trichloromonas sp. TaxID=3069249 RepID=UPI003D814CB8
ALHADYGLLIERQRNSTSVRYLLVNIRTGASFETQSVLPADSGAESDGTVIIENTWKRLYQLARKDLFETALRKGRDAGPVELPTPLDPQAETAPVGSLPAAAPATGDRPLLAVYDFAADGPMGAAAAILADALREELLKQGKVLLVKRERVSQVLQDMAISQLGLDDDSRAIDAGKALAASQVVTGQFGVMGGSSVLQVKRIEIRSHIERFIGSTRCPQGREALLLEELPALARDIAMGL